MTSQIETSGLKFRMLHTLYNLSLREKRKKTFVVQANSKVTFPTIRRL